MTRREFVERELARLRIVQGEEDLALAARVKALQERANDRPEFVRHRASVEYQRRYFGVGDPEGRDD